MIEFTRQAVSIFGFKVYYYGLILMTGVLAAVFLSMHQAKKKGLDTVFLWDSVFLVVVGGIIGARLWHIITPPPSMVEQGITFQYYLTHPLDALNIRSGGLGLPGAVIGGLVVFFWYSRKKGQPFLIWVDTVAPAIPLGQAIGRWGNFVNQELYGAPSDLPWAIFIEPGFRLPEFKDVAYYHPIFLYEALWNLGSVFLLLWISRRFEEKLKPGDVFLAYMVTYPIIRILLDFIRLDASMVGGINANQVFMALILILALGLLFFRRRPEKEQGEDKE